VREYNPDLDRALRLEHGRHELRRVLRWPPLDVDHEPPDSTCGPVRCACGRSGTGTPRGVVRITRVVRQQTVVTETVPERPIHEGPGVLAVTLGLVGALVGALIGMTGVVAHGDE